MTRNQSPQKIIEHCLAPLHLNEQSPAAQEALRRLTDAFETRQNSRPSGARLADGERMPSIVINEAAHGYEA